MNELDTHILREIIFGCLILFGLGYIFIGVLIQYTPVKYLVGLPKSIKKIIKRCYGEDLL